MGKRIAAFFLCAGILACWPEPAAAQWEAAGTPGSSKVTALALVGNRLFAGTERHGVYVSEDRGASWRLAGQGLPQGSPIGDLAAGESTLFAISAGRAFISTSLGASWRPAGPQSAQGHYFWDLAWCGRTVIAVTNIGLLVSEDNGEQWRPARPGLPPKVRCWCLLSRGPDLYAGTSQGVFLSADRGDTWMPVGQPALLAQPVTCLAAAGEGLVAGAPDGVFSMAGSGSAWEKLRTPFPRTHPVTDLLARGRVLFAGTWQGLYYSADAGASWRLVDTPWAMSHVNGLVADAVHVFAGTETGLYRSGDDGRTWEPAGPGLPPEDRVRPLAAIGDSLFAGTGTGVSITEDNGASWRPVMSGIMIDGLVAIGSDLLASGFAEDLYSRDRGKTWESSEQSNLGMDGPVLEGGECLYRLSRYYGSFSYSLDGGKSWTGTALPLRATCVLASGPYLFAGTGTYLGKASDRDAAAKSGNSVFRSADGGKIWKKLVSRFSAPINDLAAVGRYLFVGTDRGLYVCEDLGGSPEAVKLELAEEVAVSLFKIVGAKLVVGTNKGVFFVSRTKDDSGWEASNTKFPKGLSPNSFAVAGRSLFASTAHDGVWRYRLSSD
ncbi:MAG TPA: sialidase family protein [Acidobacteriota bacterium]|nr:sialidase family protein [Acidobacteriota bacterium]